MPKESISQIPVQAFSVNGGTDLVMISQYTGNPSAPYVTRKATLSVAGSQGAFIYKGYFTLLAGQSSMFVPVPGATVTSSMDLPAPLTLHAAQAVSTTWYTMQSGGFTVNYANNSYTDRNFMFSLAF